MVAKKNITFFFARFTFKLKLFKNLNKMPYTKIDFLIKYLYACVTIYSIIKRKCQFFKPLFLVWHCKKKSVQILNKLFHHLSISGAAKGLKEVFCFFKASFSVIIYCFIKRQSFKFYAFCLINDIKTWVNAQNHKIFCNKLLKETVYC